MISKKVTKRRRQMSRSMLAVPAIRPEFFAKAAAGSTDSLFIDLEDSVFPDQKVKARDIAAKAIEATDWGDKLVLVRCNAVDTEWAFRDIEKLGSACPRLDGFLVPKIGSADELRFVENMFQHLDRERPDDRSLELHILIETAEGVAHVEDILERSERIVSVSFGVGDYSVSMGAHDRLVGGSNPDYVVLTGNEQNSGREPHWNDQWHYAMARIANACHAFGVTAIDGPFGNIADREGFKAAARRAFVLGYEGKWAIHPSQVELANIAFSPTDAEIRWALAARDALLEARKAGKGAIQYNGQLLDVASLKGLQSILDCAGIRE
jgi:malyl-CoA/(S)-citramalyl-CoA lyase